MEQQRVQYFGGEWTAVKLDKLRKYLSAYVTALKNQPFHLQYIDAFAGTGYCGKSKSITHESYLVPELAEMETQAFLKGSARIALEVEPSFDSFTFIDRDPENCVELYSLRNEFPSHKDKITIVNDEANTCLQKILRGSWKQKRAVLFLDPYGMQVQWQTVKAIARTQAIDMWYLFPIAAVNRLLRRDAELSAAWRKRLNLIFGAEDWESTFYQQKTTLTLFGPDESTEKTATFDAIKDYLLAKLKEEFAGVARNPRMLVNENNAPLFLLCFAASNPKGAPTAIRIAESVLGR